MKFYTSVNQFGNNILVRGVNNGKAVQDRIQFKPTLFVKTQKKTEYKSLYGESLDSVDFDSISDAKEFVNRYKEIENFPLFGNTNYAYQYITQTFPNEIEFDISKIKIWTLDIETTANNGFPDITNPIEEILLITIQDNITKQIKTYSRNEYNNYRDDVNYILCRDEIDLLERFMDDMGDDYPHIITGWNVEFFDIPYLSTRIEKLLGQDELRKCSPWRVVNRKDIKTLKSENIAYDWLGIAILDYLDLYKKFTYNAQESYKLDHIAKVELGQEKLSYDEYGSFTEFWQKDWQKFVDYNIRDVELVDRLEDKMKLIELILTMAYDAKCNYIDIFSAVRTWDCILYNHLWKKKIVVHQRQDRVGRQIAGAYVQEPKPDKYDWVVSFDATSLYPSIIMQYNLSPETILQKSRDVTVGKLVDKSVDLSDLKEDNCCMTSNGHCFDTTKQGIFPEIVEKLFDDRKKYKKMMLEAQQKYEETKDNNWRKEISKYNNFQMARKIQMNSLFGAMANEYFRFYDDRIAEGITLTGQYIIQTVGKALNKYLNKVCETENYLYSFYSDTDACYITLEPLVKKFFSNLPKDKLVEVLDKICQEKIENVLLKTSEDIAQYTNAYKQKIFFKREVIADRGIWVAKKRYALNVYNNEGVSYAEPKLKVMGLEIVRSSTPEPVRDALRKAVKIILTETEDTVQEYIRNFETEYRKLEPEQISFPRSVNGIDKYSDRSNIYKQATPMHVRGSLLYNFHIIQNKLDKKYQPIKEGDKIKFVYLKEPNTINENCIAFNTKIPEELDIKKFVDYDTMFEKSFLDPLNTILSSMGWSAKPKATLEGLFG